MLKVRRSQYYVGLLQKTTLNGYPSGWTFFYWFAGPTIAEICAIPRQEGPAGPYVRRVCAPNMCAEYVRPNMCAEYVRRICAPNMCAEYVRRICAPNMCAECVRRICAPNMCAECVRRICAPNMCAEYVRRMCAPNVCAEYVRRFFIYILAAKPSKQLGERIGCTHLACCFGRLGWPGQLALLGLAGLGCAGWLAWPVWLAGWPAAARAPPPPLSCDRCYL